MQYTMCVAETCLYMLGYGNVLGSVCIVKRTGLVCHYLSMTTKEVKGLRIFHAIVKQRIKNSRI